MANGTYYMLFRDFKNPVVYDDKDADLGTICKGMLIVCFPCFNVKNLLSSNVIVFRNGVLFVRCLTLALLVLIKQLYIQSNLDNTSLHIKWKAIYPYLFMIPVNFFFFLLLFFWLLCCAVE